MTTLVFSDASAERHEVRRRGEHMQVDDVRIAVRELGRGEFAALIDGRSERLWAVAHGDAIHVQLRGRAFRLERLDPVRSRAAATSASAGASLAPMPGVVVSVLGEIGQAVRQGDALLVIESMKLQMSIAAAADGVVAELPFAAGQSFQRGAVLLRIATQPAHAAANAQAPRGDAP